MQAKTNELSQELQAEKAGRELEAGQLRAGLEEGRKKGEEGQEELRKKLEKEIKDRKDEDEDIRQYFG